MAPATETTFLPIAELSAYQNKWTIKARVTDKAPLRTFKKGAGEGKVFSVELLDAAGGDIRASFFNNAVDKFYDMVEKGKCFTFSKGNVKIANKQYNRGSHRYELVFDKEAIVEPATDDANIEAIKFSFVNLKALQTKSLPCLVDLCGVITSFKPTDSVQTKDGQSVVKREVTVADETGCSMCVTLWAERASQEDKVFEGHPVVHLKSVYVKDFRESRSGSMGQGGLMVLKPAGPEAARVSQWWAQGGSSQNLVDLSQVVAGAGSGPSRNVTSTTLAGVRMASERLGNEPALFNVNARLALVQTRKQGEPQPLTYMACQEIVEGNIAGKGRTCNKRVDESGFCPSCNRAGKVAARLVARCRFVDFEDGAWITSFHEAAEKMIGMSGEKIHEMEVAAKDKGEAGREELDAKIREQYFAKPISLTIRAKLGSYNGEARTDIAVIDAKPVSHGEHGRSMLKDIEAMLANPAVAGC